MKQIITYDELELGVQVPLNHGDSNYPNEIGRIEINGMIITDIRNLEVELADNFKFVIMKILNSNNREVARVFVNEGQEVHIDEYSGSYNIVNKCMAACA